VDTAHPGSPGPRELTGVTAVDGATREAVVPDLDGGPPVHVLGVLEEILLSLRGWETDAALEPGDELELPVPFAGGRALAAVHRVQDVLRGTQNLAGVRSGLLGPGGGYEHAPLTVVTVAVADVEDLAAVARTIGAPVVPEAIEDAVESMAPAFSTTRAEVAEQLARLAGLLDLSWSPELDLLAPRIRATACGTTVWFSEEEEAAYQRLADRLNTMAGGTGVDRWLY